MPLRATLDLNLRHLQLEKTNTNDLHAVKVREKDNSIRALKKAELQLKMARDAGETVQTMHKKVKSEVIRFTCDVYANPAS